MNRLVEPGRRPGAQDERALDPRGPHPGRDMVGVEVPNPEVARGGAARAAGGRAVVGRGAAAAGGAGPRPRGPAGHRRSGEDAAPPDRRRDRHRQVGRDQRDHHVAHLPLPAQGGPPPPDDRPEDGRAVDVQGAAPSPAPGRHQQQGGRARAQVGGGRDGAALRAARGQRRPQHERLQPQGRWRGSRSGIRRRAESRSPTSPPRRPIRRHRRPSSRRTPRASCRSS